MEQSLKFLAILVGDSYLQASKVVEIGVEKELQTEDHLESKGSDEEIRRLKKMVLTFKKKYQRALQDITKQDQTLPHDAADIVKKCQELEEECNALVDQQLTLKEIITKNKHEIASIKEENAALQEQQEILKNFLAEKVSEKAPEPQENHQQLIDTLQSQLAEKDSNLRQAQQHLAKKMKEILDLKETNSKIQEALKSYIGQINKENTESIAREKDLREEISQWENKYRELHHQWQDAMDNIQGLKKVEEKHLKMQDYLKNLGNIIEGAPPTPKKSSKMNTEDALDLFNTDTYKQKDAKDDNSRD